MSNCLKRTDEKEIEYTMIINTSHPKEVKDEYGIFRGNAIKKLDVILTEYIINNVEVFIL